MSEDPLDASRGCVTGLLLGLASWVVIGWVVIFFLGLLQELI